MHDIVIVGGGSAGCLLAARLSEDPSLDVVLIEAGRDYRDFEVAPAAIRLAVGGVAVTEQLAELDWGFMATGSAVGGVIAVPRGRALGGSGAINGCIWLRGLPEDFERWEELVGAGWGWQDILPAYRAIEADPAGRDGDHGREGPFPISRFAPTTWTATQTAFHAACQELGYGRTDDHNAPGAMGVGQLPLNQTEGLRWGPARALLVEAVRRRPNLTLRTETRALDLLVEHGRVAGVRVVGPEGPSIVRGGEVILSAGAIGSPQLLLLSGVGPRAELERLGIPVVAHVPGVGQGLRDHPKTWIEWRLRDDVPGDPDDPLLQLSTRYTASDSALRGDMMLYPNSIVPGSRSGSRDFRIEAVNNLQLSSGRLRLRSADPDDKPDIDLGLLSEPRDRARLVDAIERSLALGESGPMRAIVDEVVLPSPEARRDGNSLARYVETTIMTGQHISSSCPMGSADSPTAVVGPDCRVRGVGGLRIIDGSIMPDSVRANTHATILAMAQLMAGRILAGG